MASSKSEQLQTLFQKYSQSEFPEVLQLSHSNFFLNKECIASFPNQYVVQVKSIRVSELHQLLEDKKDSDVLLIDVRTPEEQEVSSFHVLLSNPNAFMVCWSLTCTLIRCLGFQAMC
jgi:hypothetical protein